MDRFLLGWALLVTLFLLPACGGREDAMLIGKWEAVTVTEDGDSLELDPAEIGFEFTSNNRYFYRSTLDYDEAGTWKYEDGFLYAQDTTGHSTTQYIVAVDLMRPDSLLLRMQADTVERLVLLVRK